MLATFCIYIEYRSGGIQALTSLNAFAIAVASAGTVITSLSAVIAALAVVAVCTISANPAIIRYGIIFLLETVHRV